MLNTRMFAMFGLIAVVALTGAGCAKNGNRSSNTNSGAQVGGNFSDNGNGNGSASDNYKNAIDLEVAGDTNDVGAKVQAMLEDVFGDLKVTSFISNFPSEGGLTIEYTAKRNTEAKDLNKVMDLFKKKGYKVDYSGVTDGTATVATDSKEDSVFVTFDIGKAKVGAWIAPSNYFNEIQEGDEEDLNFEYNY